MAACYTCRLVNGTRDKTDRLVIAIDGPSGAGKGTIARALARHLGYRHVDTGAMYRAVAWLAGRRAMRLDDEEAVALAAATTLLDISDGRVVIDGHDVTTAIRTPEIDRAAATVARLPAVRQVLVTRQRALGAAGGIVMEGRDIGTVVFPDADLKIYLDADPSERARRRAHDPAHAGSTGPVTVVADAMAARDHLDTTRATSPLAVADDALRIDTTGMAVDDVVKRVLELVEERTRSRS
jgi:cytidylate kinase